MAINVRPFKDVPKDLREWYAWFRDAFAGASLDGFTGFSNPSAQIGPTAVNGNPATTTALRSDAAPKLANTAVTIGSYTYGSFTVDQQGRLTAASNGAAPPVGADPSASVGLTAVNGSAGTWMRSDGAPALSQSIAPTWTGSHTFNGNGTNISGTFNGPANNYAALFQGSGTSGQSYGIKVAAGTTSGDYCFQAYNSAGSHVLMQTAGDGSGAFGYNGTTNTFTWTAAGNVTLAAPSSGVGFTSTGPANNYAYLMQGSSTSGQSYGAKIAAGSTAGDHALAIYDTSGAHLFLKTNGDGSGSLGYNGTATPTIAWASGGALTLAGQTIGTGANVPTIGTNKPGSAISLTPSTWLTLVINGTTYYLPLWV